MPQNMTTQINPTTNQPWKTGDIFGSSIVKIGPNGEFQLTGIPKPPEVPWQGPATPSPDFLKLYRLGQQNALPPPAQPPIGVPPMPQGGQPPPLTMPPQQVMPFNVSAPAGVAPQPPIAPPVQPPHQVAGQQPDPAWWNQWSNFWQNQQQPGRPFSQNQTPQSFIPPTNGPQVRQPSSFAMSSIPKPELRNNGRV